MNRQRETLAVVRDADEESLIERHGWAIRGTCADVEEGTPECAYTVGLHDFGLPELLVFGLPYLIAGRVLDSLARAAVSIGASAATHLQGPLQFECLSAMPCRFYGLNGDSEPALRHAVRAGERSGGEASVVQVCWSDAFGFFPWQPQADWQMRASQPLLGLAPSVLH